MSASTDDDCIIRIYKKNGTSICHIDCFQNWNLINLIELHWIPKAVVQYLISFLPGQMINDFLWIFVTYHSTTMARYCHVIIPSLILYCWIIRSMAWLVFFSSVNRVWFRKKNEQAKTNNFSNWYSWISMKFDTIFSGIHTNCSKPMSQAHGTGSQAFNNCLSF